MFFGLPDSYSAQVSFLIQSFIISLSGVMAPGPMTAATIAKGHSSPHAGLFIALGHGVIELPLMILIYFGFSSVFNNESVKISIGLLGGMFLLKMGFDMFKSIKNIPDKNGGIIRQPLLIGLILSACNPYFLLWWISVGAVLIITSIKYGMIWFILFAVIHWLTDLIWLYFLSAVSFKGKNYAGQKLQTVFFKVCGVFLIFFGINYIVDSIKLLSL